MTACVERIVLRKGALVLGLNRSQRYIEPREYLERNSPAVDVLQNATDNHDQFS
jgi:hypothetical protein